MWIPKKRTSKENHVRLVRLEDLLRVLWRVYKTNGTNEGIWMSAFDGFRKVHLWRIKGEVGMSTALRSVKVVQKYQPTWYPGVTGIFCLDHRPPLDT